MLLKQYKLFEKGNLKGEYTAEEIAKLIGINPKSVSRYCNVGKEYQKIYTFEDAEPREEEISRSDFAERWREMQKLFEKGAEK